MKLLQITEYNAQGPDEAEYEGGSMAGTITHLVIAHEVLKRLPEPLRNKIRNEALFYCGNLAPDAIMNRKNYVRSMKRRTHFKEDVRLNELHIPEKYAVYRKRLEEFEERFLFHSHKDYELYLGYVAHILADEIFILTVRDNYVKKLTEEGKDPGKDENFRAFGRDVEVNDLRLAGEYPFSCDIVSVLRSEKNYEIEDYVTNQELEDSKADRIERFFLTGQRAEEATEYTYEENMEYIEAAAERIAAELAVIMTSAPGEDEDCGGH